MLVTFTERIYTSIAFKGLTLIFNTVDENKIKKIIFYFELLL